MKITWFGHSCFRIDAGASSILIDPFLSFNQTFANAGVPSHHAIKGVTHVALTHSHEDHTDDTVTICRDTRRPRCSRWGVDEIDPGNTGGTLYHKDFNLTFVPAWHSASPMVDGQPLYPELDQTADKFVDEMGQTPVLVPKVGVPFEV